MVHIPVLTTEPFTDAYLAVPHRDLPAVNGMMERLGSEHDTAEMRSIVKVGSLSLYATPRIDAPTAIYRITWMYDSRDRPTAVHCITIAEI